MAEATTGRAYQMRKRREDIEQTRQRIIDAAVELHGSVGPINTTFSAVAERAGVQRSTVYRHFTDEAALFSACTSHWLASHPWPRPDDWRAEPDPVNRLRRGITELYRFYAANTDMLANSFRDIDVMPAFVGEFMHAQLRGIYNTLLEAWPDDARDHYLTAAIAHALDFRTWQSLSSQTLSAEAAAELLTTMVAGGLQARTAQA
ncbi:MAG TPA: helix-turn-helix domain-containing protein [Jiangellaceae bacterium]